MICYLVRHGQDDPDVRGGWSDSPLVEEGEEQALMLAQTILESQNELCISRILSSDLPRAADTAQPAAEALGLEVELRPEFREINNGELAGMDNNLALVRYPGLFYSTLEWDEAYPGGESPHQFQLRIKDAWERLCKELVEKNQNVLLFTHSGVIHIIHHLIHQTVYSNSEKQFHVPHTSPIPVEYCNGAWHMD